MKRKTIIILVIVLVIVIGLIITLVVVKNKKANKQKQADLEAQLLLLQQQAVNPNVPQSDKPSILAQIAALAAAIKAAKAGVVGTDPKLTLAQAGITELNWNGGGIGMCVNPAKLSLVKNLSKGINSMEVCQLQSMLNKQGATLTVDGKFGLNTENALKANANGATTIALNQIPRSYFA